MAKLNKKETVEEDKLIIKCSCCGHEKAGTEYYSSTSYIHKNTGKLSICKQCVWDYVVTNTKSGYDIHKMKDILQMTDKAFVHSLLVSSKEEAESSKYKKNIFKTYMKNIVMPQNKNLRWSDSKFSDEADFSNHSYDYDAEDNNLEITSDTIKYWNKGYSDWEYNYLNEERIKLMSSFECPDYGMEMIMKDICFINLDIEKLRQEKKPNSHSEITKLIKARSDLMNSANMNPIQSTGAEANDQITFGTLIKKLENDRPVPKQLEDEMKDYIDTYMAGHLAKMEGLNNELTDKYDKALSEYTIDFNEINNLDDENESDDL